MLLGSQRGVARQANPGALEEMPVSVTDEQRLDKRPFGPAIVDSEERAVNTIMRRLNADKEAIVSIDLEGHQLGAGGQVSLVQLAIDEGLDGEPQLVYVFDVPRTSAVCSSSEEGRSPSATWSRTRRGSRCSIAYMWTPWRYSKGTESPSKECSIWVWPIR